jgi:hypothetical protein
VHQRPVAASTLIEEVSMRIHRAATMAAVTGLSFGALQQQHAGAAPPVREHESFAVADSIDCSVFGHGWNFVDHFVDEFEVERTYYYDRDGELVRVVERWEQHSTDVNSVTGVTINEHNRFVAVGDLVEMTLTINGSMNSAQRRGVGSVIRRAGHKVWELDLTQDPPFGSMLFNAGPLVSDDEDFCQALA